MQQPGCIATLSEAQVFRASPACPASPLRPFFPKPFLMARARVRACVHARARGGGATRPCGCRCGRARGVSVGGLGCVRCWVGGCVVAVCVRMRHPIHPMYHCIPRTHPSIQESIPPSLPLSLLSAIHRVHPSSQRGGHARPARGARK